MICCRSSRTTAHHLLQSNPPRPLVLAIHLAFAGSLLPGAGYSTEAHAQTTAAAPATRSYDIPAGPLSDVLTHFSTEAGIFLAGSTELAQGKHSRGVRGTYGVQAALDALLAGTGLEMQRNAQGRYVLQVVERVTDDVAMLPAVSVTAQVVKDGTTEGTGSYTSNSVSTSTKLNLSLRETPQTMTVVTRQQMDDFALTTVDKVLENTSGVYAWRAGNAGATYYTRGFNLQMQYDGIANPAGIGSSNMNASPDSAFLDHVEILQGASGLLSGAGEPGGTINLVRKRPTDSFQANVEAQLGSWGKRRFVGDISGSLVASGAIRGRIVAVSDNSDSFADYVYDDKIGVYGIIEADLTPTTTVGASIQYQKNDTAPGFGVPTTANGTQVDWSRSSYFAGANDYSDRETKLYTINLEQKLPADWVLKATWLHSSTDVDRNSNILFGTPLASQNGQINISQSRQTRDIQSETFDFSAAGPFELLGRKHDLIFGANGFRSEFSTILASRNIAIANNVYAFNPNAMPENTAPSVDTGALITRQKGIFGATRLNFSDSLKLIAGARVSWYEYDNKQIKSTKQEDGVVSPYAGLIYDINKQYSLYASYSDIFNPQSAKNIHGEVLPPVTGANYEVGVKGELLDRRLNVAAAVFRLEQTNLSQADTNTPTSVACGGNCSVAQGKLVSDGVDLGLNGELARGWNASVGYTYVRSKYAKGVNVGTPYGTQIPRHMFRIATTYRIPDTRWTVGGSLRAQSETYREGTFSGVAYKIQQGGFATVGLTAKYEISNKTDLTLAAENLFDRTYLTPNQPTSNHYGDPRNFNVTLRHRF